MFRKIEYEEVEKFIDPIKIITNFPIDDIHYFFRDYSKIEQDIKDCIIYEYDKVINNIFPNGNYDIEKLYSLSFTPHKDKYDLRLHPITFINNILAMFNYETEIPYIDLDDVNGFNNLEDYISAYIEPLTKFDVNEIDILEGIIENKKLIENLYNFNINEIIKSKLTATGNSKDLLFYLACKSLYNYKHSKDVRYSLLPYQYYHKISDMRNTEFPHMLDNYWYNDFRADYENILGEKYVPNIERYRLSVHDFIIGLEILRPGQVDNQIKTIVQMVRSNPNVDYDKYRELFERKMNFYKSSNYKSTLVGRYGLNGYMGFAYPNEYLVFDKLYNSDTKDPSKRTILTHGEAIYALPSDRFDIVTKTKQHIITEKEKDLRIKKLNHTDTFITRLNPIITGPNVSYNTFEEEMEKQSKKMLILSK